MTTEIDDILDAAIKTLEAVIRNGGPGITEMRETKKWITHPIPEDKYSGIDELYGIRVEYDPKCPKGSIYLVDKKFQTDYENR